MSPKHVIVLRHGQTAMSASAVYSSRTDVELNEVGRQVAALWAPNFRDAEVVAYHSTLRRAVETATFAGLTSTADSELREWDLGDLEGRSAEAFRAANPEWNLFRDGPPGGENVAEAVTRADRVVARVADEQAPVIALVGHGQFSKVLATRLLGLPLDAAVRFAWGPGRAAVFTWRDSLGGYTLAGWNRTSAPLEELLDGNS
jgi:broad specificity phosphatase PhoE